MITCQFSVYPLRTERISEILREVLKEVEAIGITYEMGPMSTKMQGDEEQVFTALKGAFAKAATQGDVVLVATVSNACR